MHKRARTRGASSSSAPEPPTVHAINIFQAPAHIARYQTLRTLPIEANRHWALDDLHALGIGDEVEGLIDRAGWRLMVEIREHSFRELMHEFLSTFSFEKALIRFDKEDVIQFRLGGMAHSMSISQFGVALGFYTEEFQETEEYKTSYLQFPAAVGIPRNFWLDIIHGGNVDTDSNYDPTRCKSTGIASPALRYVHRLIAHSIGGRRESTGVVTLRDLFYLWCLVEGHHCNLGASMAYYFEGMANKKRGAICGGTYITRLAKNLRVFHRIRGMHIGARMTAIDFDVMRNMRLIERVGAQYRLRPTMRGDPDLPEEQPPVDPMAEDPPLQPPLQDPHEQPAPSTDIPSSSHADETKPTPEELRYNDIQYRLFHLEKTVGHYKRDLWDLRETSTNMSEQLTWLEDAVMVMMRHMGAQPPPAPHRNRESDIEFAEPPEDVQIIPRPPGGAGGAGSSAA